MLPKVYLGGVGAGFASDEERGVCETGLTHRSETVCWWLPPQDQAHVRAAHRRG